MWCVVQQAGGPIPWDDGLRYIHRGMRTYIWIEDTVNNHIREGAGSQAQVWGDWVCTDAAAKACISASTTTLFFV